MASRGPILLSADRECVELSVGSSATAHVPVSRIAPAVASASGMAGGGEWGDANDNARSLLINDKKAPPGGHGGGNIASDHPRDIKNED